MVASFSDERLREESEQSMSDKYPVIVWGTGVVGKLVIRELLDHPVFELAAVLVHDPAKDGVDVGTLVGSHPTGLAATTDIDAALGTEALSRTSARPRSTRWRTSTTCPAHYAAGITSSPPP
ncbi:Putative dihydropicolinate reductase [Mycobacteroides abscessus subsp. abscessus]|nr:Putative dihydropicolinate reductase [Mycobacteroides abscessus subsp. abscessus]